MSWRRREPSFHKEIEHLMLVGVQWPVNYQITKCLVDISLTTDTVVQERTDDGLMETEYSMCLVHRY